METEMKLQLVNQGSNNQVNVNEGDTMTNGEF